MFKKILTGITAACIAFSMAGCGKQDTPFNWETDSQYDLTAAMTSDSLKEQCSDYFKLGVGLTGNNKDNAAVNSPEYMAIVDRHFNSVTLTNLMKPTNLLDKEQCISNAKKGDETAVAVTFEVPKATLDWCLENNMQMRGHTLIWHNQTPDWFFRAGYDESGEYVDKDTMIKRMENYISAVITYCQENYPGVIYCWDVVNECIEPSSAPADSFFACRTENNNWYKVIGEEYVELAYTFAREYADEDVKLFYNDYNVCGTKKLEYVYALCKDLSEKGLLDGLGLQDCWTVDWPSIDKIEQGITKFDDLDIEIHISEMSITIDNLLPYNLDKQADRYEEIFTLLQRLDTTGGGNSNITAVTIFGLMDGFVFYSNDETNYTMFDCEFQPKPCFERVQKVFKEIY